MLAPHSSMLTTKLVAIVGPTGTGKSDLALYLAQRADGEIICADSRTVYRGMDIGTAKPSKAEQAMVPHHLLDIASPNETVNVAMFQRFANQAINQVQGRGSLPILVGGSGLYVDSVLYDYVFPEEANQESRIKNQELEMSELVGRLQKLDPKAASQIDLKNRRRVERAIELAGMRRSMSKTVRQGTLVLGLAMDKKLIRQRIDHRIYKMLSEGLIAEVKSLGTKYGWEVEAMRAPAYVAFREVVEGRATEAEAAAEFLRRDMRLVKKQLTWFRRNTAIEWLDASQPDTLKSQALALVRKSEQCKL
jgi:tRNA dimethylallyltransferase